MKYIRTKDGRIHEIEDGILKNGGDVSIHDVFGGSDVVERLFDRIEARKPWPNCKCNCDCATMEIKDYLNGDRRIDALRFEGYTVYGVTDNWGTIHYVAKLNEKGEWELLSEKRTQQKLSKRLIEKAAKAYGEHYNGYVDLYSELALNKAEAAVFKPYTENYKDLDDKVGVLDLLLKASFIHNGRKEASLDFVCKALELLGYEIEEDEKEESK